MSGKLTSIPNTGCKYDEDGNLFSPDYQGGTKPIANHTPLLERVECHILPNGESDYKYLFKCISNGKEYPAVDVPRNVVTSNTPYIKFRGGCTISRARGCKGLYQDVMEKQMNNAPDFVIHRHIGYAMIDGKHVFLNYGYSVTPEGLTDAYTVELASNIKGYRFDGVRKDERFETLKQVFELGKQDVIYPLLGYTFLTPLNALLREVDNEPRFILYLIGETNNGKSTLAKLFLSFFGNYRGAGSAPANFRDSENAIQAKMGELDSTLFLIDDRTPNTSLNGKAQMEKLEQAIARFVGDRCFRDRLTKEGQLQKQAIPGCNVIVTGEQAFENIGASGVARSLSVKVEKSSFDFAALTELQAKKNGHLNQCMSEFIQWILNDWENLQPALTKRFDALMQDTDNVAHGRVNMAAAHLQLGFETLCTWLKRVGVISNEEFTERTETAWEIFKTMAGEQDKLAQDEKPHILFIKAINEMIATNEIWLCAIKTGSPMPVSDRLVVYEDGGEWVYFPPDATIARIKAHYNRLGIEFNGGDRTLRPMLFNAGYIKKEGKSYTHKKRIGNTNMRWLWVKRSLLAWDN